MGWSSCDLPCVPGGAGTQNLRHRSVRTPSVVSATGLLLARCAARLSGGRCSSLVGGGPDGLPLDPRSMLPSPLTLDGWVGHPEVTGKPNQQKTPAKFALLAVADKVIPWLHGGNLPWGCSK